MTWLRCFKKNTHTKKDQIKIMAQVRRLVSKETAKKDGLKIIEQTDIKEVQVLEQRETEGLGVRVSELLTPLLFPVRRGSSDLVEVEEMFYKSKGWVGDIYKSSVNFFGSDPEWG